MLRKNRFLKVPALLLAYIPLIPDFGHWIRIWHQNTYDDNVIIKQLLNSQFWTHVILMSYQRKTFLVQTDKSDHVTINQEKFDYVIIKYNVIKTTSSSQFKYSHMAIVSLKTWKRRVFIAIFRAYAIYYRRWMENFDRSQLLVVDGSDMLTNPSKWVTMAQVKFFQFLHSWDLVLKFLNKTSIVSWFFLSVENSNLVPL